MAVVHLRREPVLHGEWSVLDALRGLDDDWHVFYSLGFLDRRGFDRQRELDYLALHRTKGIVFIEVKGGRVRFDNGRVEQFLDGGWIARDPVKQLNNARRVALEYLSRNHEGFMPARMLYCFPATERPSAGLGQEISDAGLFGVECGQITRHIETLCSEMTAQLDVEALIATLEPCLTLDAREELVHIPDYHPPRELTLRQIEAAGPGVFSTLDDVRVTIADHRSRLQALWDRVSSGSTELEIAQGVDVMTKSDLLSSLMNETDNVLSTTYIDIGVFGQVKRGKSTLVNALAGREVSAVGILPKTAVPVTIEWASEESGAIAFADGSHEIVPVGVAIEATTQADRKRRIRDGEALVDRVLVRLPLEWLPRGVRIIDTPGLADPSMTDVYETYTKSEMDRLSAGVFVISYPPGPEANEIRLVSTLGSYGMAKMFFVVNMWSDVWRKKGARKEAVEYVEELLAEANSSGSSFDRSDARVFAVNLGMARDGQDDNDERKVTQSGLPALQEAIETFLAGGALPRIASSAARRLLKVGSVIEATLTERQEALSNPGRVIVKRQELEKTLAHSSSVLQRIIDSALSECERLRLELEDVAAQPFRAARSSIAASSRRSILRSLESRMSIEAGTAASRLSSAMLRRSSDIVASTRNQLTVEVGASTWAFMETIDVNSIYVPEFAERAILPERGPSDFKAEGRGIGSIIGAMLGGGGGIALAATGPIGLIIGGLLGYALGDAFGNLSSDPGTSDEVSDDEISRLLAAINEAEARSRSGVATVVEKFSVQLQRSLQRQRDLLLEDSRREVKVLERLLADSASRERARQDITGSNDALKAITG